MLITVWKTFSWFTSLVWVGILRPTSPLLLFFYPSIFLQKNTTATHQQGRKRSSVNGEEERVKETIWVWWERSQPLLSHEESLSKENTRLMYPWYIFNEHVFVLLAAISGGFSQATLISPRRRFSLLIAAEGKHKRYPKLYFIFILLHAANSLGGKIK